MLSEKEIQSASQPAHTPPQVRLLLLPPSSPPERGPRSMLAYVHFGYSCGRSDQRQAREKIKRSVALSTNACILLPQSLPQSSLSQGPGEHATRLECWELSLSPSIVEQGSTMHVPHCVPAQHTSSPSFSGVVECMNVVLCCVSSPTPSLPRSSHIAHLPGLSTRMSFLVTRSALTRSPSSSSTT